jgi:hypothetical protein
VPSDELLENQKNLQPEQQTKKGPLELEKEKIASENITVSSTYDQWLKYFEIIALEKLLVLRSSDETNHPFIVQNYFPLSDQYDNAVYFKSEAEADLFFREEVARIKTTTEVCS